jgi:hypothetical protein
VSRLAGEAENRSGWPRSLLGLLHLGFTFQGEYTLAILESLGITAIESVAKQYGIIVDKCVNSMHLASSTSISSISSHVVDVYSSTGFGFLVDLKTEGGPKFPPIRRSILKSTGIPFERLHKLQLLGSPGVCLPGTLKSRQIAGKRLVVPGSTFFTGLRWLF